MSAINDPENARIRGKSGPDENGPETVVAHLPGASSTAPLKRPGGTMTVDQSTQNEEHETSDDIEFLRSELAIASRSSQRNANAHMAAEAEARQLRGELSESRHALQRLAEDAEELARFIERAGAFEFSGSFGRIPLSPATKREGQVRVDNLRLALASTPESGSVVDPKTGRRGQAIELIYRMLCDHGWAEHYRCGWYDGPQGEGTIPGVPMCNKEVAERESVAEIVDALYAAGLVA